VPKMTVYVPDYLWEPMQKREDVKWSQVFQRAVKEELHMNVARPALPELDNTIDIQALRQRLRAERAEIYRRGYAAGLQAAERLSYGDFHYCEEAGWDTDKILFSTMFGDYYEHLKSIMDPALRDVVRGWHVSDDLTDPGFVDTGRSGSAKAFRDAFVDGLHRAWELVTQEDNAVSEPNE